ncbi:MAG: glutathione S-transferase family protein [Phenylobacterium sp.]|uniref:glutathione S-transferase family protein n=1 Tax=Phenylobacterium sp. TaxID=1871053 RepID=UPI002718FFF6|nr:glutathione S-transferase family protein [Phenylobacterium sp.]MDO8912860.1 glutathione S-transferase family protein [Phenylobacterium sp.]MDP2009278.1 glutathione S-transferase family protein [Phenylobacterium sp.]MDP3101540.1 glutathione S-transferase family protein [Phenylobacterium sp.]MDP3632099.1 glutathione S-transferase family protein [Phenylobacterium sp.]MDP3870216.1 glutathione S-transferase family protein [Phenylobacterium sp.]
MKLYGAPNPAPNPRRVRIFLAEKGIDLPETPVNMMKREHKSPEFRAKNSLGQLPTLELDDGTTISETVAICRYLEETNPEPPLFGTTAVERALVDQWIRRVEFTVMTPVGMYWRHAHPRTAALLTQFKDFGESNAETYKGAQKYLDRELEGHQFVVGDTYTMADICLLSTVDFAEWIGLPMEPEFEHLKAWHDRVTARPSANA